MDGDDKILNVKNCIFTVFSALALILIISIFSHENQKDNGKKGLLLSSQSLSLTKYMNQYKERNELKEHTNKKHKNVRTSRRNNRYHCIKQKT